MYLNSNFYLDSSTLLSLNVPGGYKRKPANLDVTIGYRLANGIELSIWGRNLTGSKYNTAIFPGTAQAGSYLAYPSEPRTYGATSRYRF